MSLISYSIKPPPVPKHYPLHIPLLLFCCSVTSRLTMGSAPVPNAGDEQWIKICQLYLACLIYILPCISFNLSKWLISSSKCLQWNLSLLIWLRLDGSNYLASKILLRKRRWFFNLDGGIISVLWRYSFSHSAHTVTWVKHNYIIHNVNFTLSNKGVMVIQSHLLLTFSFIILPCAFSTSPGVAP